MSGISATTAGVLLLSMRRETRENSYPFSFILWREMEVRRHHHFATCTKRSSQDSHEPTGNDPAKQSENPTNLRFEEVSCGVRMIRSNYTKGTLIFDTIGTDEK